MDDLLVYGTVLPIVVGLAANGINAIRRSSMFRKKKVAQLEQKAEVARGGNALLVPQEPPRRTGGMKLEGTRMVVGIGTVGAKRVFDMLVTHERDGVDDDIGSIIFYECASGTRKAIEADLPAVYRERAIFAYSPEYPDGFGNDTPQEVASEVKRWSVPLLEGIERIIRLHEERNHRTPAEVLLFISLGGHTYPALFAVKEIRRLLSKVPIFVVVNLPNNEEQRDYFLNLKPSFDQEGVTGWLIGDQMEGDFVTQDGVLGDLFAGCTAVSLYSDTNTRFNNIATGVTGKNVGGIARFEYCYGEVVATAFQPDPKIPPIYYVSRDQVINETQRLISIIERGRADLSIDAPVGEYRRKTYDLVLLALEPKDILSIRDHIEKARRIEDEQFEEATRPHLHDQPNYQSVYTYWVRSIDPKHPRCKVAVIRLRSLHNVEQHLPTLVKVPKKRSYSSPLAPAVVATNGFSLDEFDKI